jgi:hemerythrin
MAFMTWTKEMGVSVEVLDEDHRKLIEIINELHDGILAGHKKEILSAVLDRLIEYTIFHFAREEDYFAKASYSSASMHMLEHEAMVRKISNLQQRLKNAPIAMLDLELMGYLRTWLVTHIQGSDKKYGPRLNAMGIH